MIAGLADTSVFIARESGRQLDTNTIPDRMCVSIVTIGELRAGVLGAASVEARRRRLATLDDAMLLDPFPIDLSVAEAWAGLRVLLRDRGRRMEINDSWIAATALSLGVPVVTQDDDYDGIDGLDVIKV